MYAYPSVFHLITLAHFPQLTVVGMKHSDERVALQAVEFWSTVCEEEVDLALEAQEVRLDFPNSMRSANTILGTRVRRCP